MSESVSVKISSTGFAFIMYDNNNSHYNLEGFLLGKLNTTTKSAVTDNDREVVNIEHEITIKTTMPCVGIGSYYAQDGEVDILALHRILGKHFDRVIGWFKFKRQGGLKMFLRESLIFKQLSKIFSPQAPELFVCLMMTERYDGGTATFSQTMKRFHNGAYQPVPLHIINLSDSYDMYKSPEDTSEEFQQLIGSLNIAGDSAEDAVAKVEEAMDGAIKDMIGKVVAAERRLFNIQQETVALQKRLQVIHADEGDDDDEEDSDDDEDEDDHRDLTDAIEISSG